MNANLPSGFPWTREEVPPPVIANYYAVVRQWKGGPTEEEQDELIEGERGSDVCREFHEAFERKLRRFTT